MKKATKEKERENESSRLYSKSLGAIRATVFENRKEDRIYYNVQVNRRYRSADGAWHDSNVLNGESDVTHLIEVLHCVNRFLQRIDSITTDDANGEE